MKTLVDKKIEPTKIMQIGMGFWASKVVLTAVKIDLFTFLARGERSGIEIKEQFKLHERGLYDFLDALVALGFLERRGIKETAFYINALDTNHYLDRNKPSYIGGVLEGLFLSR